MVYAGKSKSSRQCKLHRPLVVEAGTASGPGLVPCLALDAVNAFISRFESLLPERSRQTSAVRRRRAAAPRSEMLAFVKARLVSERLSVKAERPSSDNMSLRGHINVAVVSKGSLEIARASSSHTAGPST